MAQESGAGAGTLYGHVHDPLGDRLPGAQVTLLRRREGGGDLPSGGGGGFRFALSTPGRYSLRVSAPGFETTTSAPEFVQASSGSTDVEVTLATATRATR